MCLILDKNIAHEIAQNNEEAQPIADWLEARKGILATGGDNLIELLDTRIGRLIRECLRDGRARNFSGPELDASKERFTRNDGVRSDDHHVLALASVSRSRVVYTRDRDLMDDFRDPVLINKPGGAIYSSQGNADLLMRCGNC